MLDIIIIIIILFGALIGYKRGIIKQSVITIGFVLVLVLSFVLKNPISAFMYKNFPFFSFYGLYENISILNILLYELISFSIAFSVLSALLIILVKISNTFEKLLKITIILGFLSKILGSILGAIEYYLIVFICLFILMQPVFELNDSYLFKNSKIKDVIIEKTPLISGYIRPTIKTINKIEEVVENKDNYSDKEFNCIITDIMVKNKVITKKSLDYLYSSGKIKNKCKLGD